MDTAGAWAVFITPFSLPPSPFIQLTVPGPFQTCQMGLGKVILLQKKKEKELKLRTLLKLGPWGKGLENSPHGQETRESNLGFLGFVFIFQRPEREKIKIKQA